MCKTKSKILLVILTISILITLLSVSVYASEPAADITVQGYQKTIVKDGVYSVRFIATGSALDGVDAVGFEISVDGKNIDKSGNVVYKSLNANYGSEKITAESYGAEYITGMAITDIPESLGTLEFEVKPYVVKNGSKIYGTTKSATVEPQKYVSLIPEGDGIQVDWENIIGHTHDYVTVPGKEATCTESGLTDGKQCSICGNFLVQQETVPAKGHTEEILQSVAPTYTSTGLTEGKKCSVCNTILIEQEVIPILTDIRYYLDGVRQTSAPQNGNYVVYIKSSTGLNTTKWNYTDWTYEKVSQSTTEEYDIYFFTVSKLYDSYASIKSAASGLTEGTIVGTTSYYSGNGRGAGVYQITSSSANGALSLGGGRYALPIPFTVGTDKIITVDMFGAYGDGVTDDYKTINKAFDFVDCNIIEFEGSSYLQKSGIYIGRSDVTVNGNGAKISNEYTDGVVHWIDFDIYGSNNLTLKNITLYLSETKGQGTLFQNNDHVQLRISNSNNVTVDNVSVICPNNSTEDRHVTSIWANGDINNITIQNCHVENISKSSVGGGIWISAGEDKSTANIKILNNYIEKSSHDEILAFFIGDFDGILVEGNYIYSHDEPIGDASAHAIGFGVWNIPSLITNAVFKNNTVDVVAENDAFVFASIDGLEIYNNNITLRNNSPSDGLYLGVFRVADPTTTTQSNLNIYDNEITVINTSNSRLAALVYDMGSGCSFYGNTFTVDSKIAKIVDGTVNTDAAFYSNTVVINMDISGSYSEYSENNDITVKG